MRKAFFLLCLAAGLLSCAKDALNSGEGDTQNEGAPMTFNVTVAETKAVKADWADGDKIYVFFNGLATKYLVLTYDGTEWTNTSGGGTLLDSDFSDLGTKTLTAVHFPVAVDVSYDVDMDIRHAATSRWRRRAAPRRWSPAGTAPGCPPSRRTG